MAAFFEIEVRGAKLTLPPGEFIVGRGEGCHLLLDDGLISRRHAAFRVSDGALSIVDLDSRNGVRVNGAPIREPTPLRAGDVITIGSYDLRVLRVTTTPQPRDARKFLTTASRDGLDDGATGTTDAMWAIIERALASGSTADAERVAADALHRTRLGVEAGRIDGAGLAQPTRCALRLAAATGKGLWLDWVFDTHRAADAVLPAGVVDEIHVIARKIRYAMSPRLRAYVDDLAPRMARLNATERFAVQRLQGLVRTLLAGA